MSLTVTPVSDLQVSKHYIPAHGLVPNTSLQGKPLLIYHSAFAAAAPPSSPPPLSSPPPPGGVVPAAAIEAHLASVGAVAPQWRYTMYARSHFHSTAHEVLCVSAGRARLCFGGEANPGRVEATVRAGDVVVVPAGVAHRLREDLGAAAGLGAFEMVGGYPRGRVWDMCYGVEGEEERVAGIAALPWFDRDPVYGRRGPALEV